MSGQDAKIEAQRARASENRGLKRTAQPGGEGGVDPNCSGDEYLGQRTVGAFGAGEALVGGILAQLIQDAEDRLGEAEECITWYQREKQKQVRRLATYRDLVKLSEEEPGE
jgi:hypothetical protein